jgi:hypothetical protein
LQPPPAPVSAADLGGSLDRKAVAATGDVDIAPGSSASASATASAAAPRR